MQMMAAIEDIKDEAIESSEKMIERFLRNRNRWGIMNVYWGG